MFTCLKCGGDINLTALGGGDMKCPHCGEYLLDSIAQATKDAIERAQKAGETTALVGLEEQVEMTVDGGNVLIPGFTPAEGADPHPSQFSNTGGSASSEPWPKSGSVPVTPTAAIEPVQPKVGSRASPPRLSAKDARASPYSR